MNANVEPIRRAKKRGGFTVIELLVAASITAVLGALLIGITSSVLGTWNRSRSVLSAGNQAKFALDQISADLEAACFRADGRVWLAATIQDDQVGSGDAGADAASWTFPSSGLRKPGARSPNGSLVLTPNSTTVEPELQRIEGFRFGMAGVWLRFFAVVPDRNSGLSNLSAPRAIGYQLMRHEIGSESDSPCAYSLFRSSANPDQCFVEGFSLFESVNNLGTASAYNVGYGVQGSPGNIRRPSSSDLLANNVVDFGIRLWIRTSGGSRSVMFPRGSSLSGWETLGFAARSGTPSATAPNSVPPEPAGRVPGFDEMGYGFPDEAEVFLRILDDDAVPTLQAIERGDVAVEGDWWQWVESHSRVFTRTVQFLGRPAP